MSYFDYEGNRIFYEAIGDGKPLILLHGNTASSKMLAPVIPLFSENYKVIIMDFLGCGQSDRVREWPTDLWYEWSKQVVALCDHLNLSKVNLIGCSGGTLTAINVALENPERIDAVVADSFEGLNANASITDQIRIGRSYAKQNEGFCSMLKMMHGDDWEKVLDADTEAVVSHAKTVGEFFHRPISELQSKLLLTGSAEDEMFPKGHYERLFHNICSQTTFAESYIFEHGGHPAMMSNMEAFVSMCKEFLINKFKFTYLFL